MTALFLSWNFATIWRTIGWRTKVSIFMKIMMNFPPFKISYFSSFIFQDPLQYNIPSFIHLLHFSTLRELFLRYIGNRVSIFFRGIIFYTIGLVNYFFFFFIWQVKSREIVQRPRADSVFPVISHPLEGFCSRIFNLYHFPVQNVIWSNMQQEKIHSRYKYYSIPLLHFGLAKILSSRSFSLPSTLIINISIFFHFIKDELKKLRKMIKFKKKQTRNSKLVYITRCFNVYSY